MGAELLTKVKIGSKLIEAKVLLGTSEIIIRGEYGMKIPFNEMKLLAAKNGSLTFSFEGKSVSIDVGEKAAKWLGKIKNPKKAKQRQLKMWR